MLGTSNHAQSDDPEFTNMDLKMLCPPNKDYCIYTWRHVLRDVDSPDKLKDEMMYRQCKDVVPLPQYMEIGFFQHSKKMWINNKA